jgi:hypothetical protein
MDFSLLQNDDLSRIDGNGYFDLLHSRYIASGYEEEKIVMQVKMTIRKD